MNAPITEMTGETALMLRRTFNADLSTLWPALTDPKAWLGWFGGGHATPIESAADLRPGGAWFVEFRGNESGNIFRVSGEFVSIEPETGLSFTWGWSFGEGHVSQVSYRLSPVGDDRTTLTLNHERLPTSEARDQHGRGWTASIDRLDTYLGG